MRLPSTLCPGNVRSHPLKKFYSSQGSAVAKLITDKSNANYGVAVLEVVGKRIIEQVDAVSVDVRREHGIRECQGGTADAHVGCVFGGSSAFRRC